MRLLNGVLACQRALRAWRAHVLGVLACFTYSCVYVLGVLHKMGCLAFLKLVKCFLDVFSLHTLPAWRAHVLAVLACLACFAYSRLYVLGVFHNMACLACFLR